MIYNDILTQEELEALLTPEELEAFKAEQQSRLEHELMLSPAHLLLAVRELGDTVARLTARVEQLENQLAHKQPIVEPEVLPVVNQVIETALFERPVMDLEGNSLTAVSIYEQDRSALDNIEMITAVTQEELETEEVLMPEITSMEMSMVLSSDLIVTDTAIDPPTEHEISAVHRQEEGLISRSDRHRERKPSLLSKLLK